MMNHLSAQDYLYKKSGGGISCKVKEITIDVIRYKRTDLAKSPIFEIKLEDIYRIRYNNGVTDIIDPEYYKMTKASLNTMSDTASYAMIYIVFHGENSTQNFPLYINGQYVCKLKSNSRATYRIFTEGEIEIYRSSKEKVGPIRSLQVYHGSNYGVSISIVNEQKLDPNERFQMIVNDDPVDVKDFIDKEYNGLKPYKDLDFHLAEY